VKLTDDQAKWALKVALNQTQRFGPTSLGNEDYAASAVEKLLEQESEPANIEAWLRLVVTNMMLDRSRKLRARKPSLRGLEPDQIDAMIGISKQSSLSTSIVNREFVSDLLDSLSEKEQRLLILDSAGFKTSEIAEELGYASAKVVATRLKQIRNRLKDKISSRSSD
jgi:RNA polymerase sigma factor (sigma-70 family)